MKLNNSFEQSKAGERLVKLIIILFLFLFCPASFANNCPNFSGRYRSLDGQIYRIYQNDCSSIRMLMQEDIMKPSVELKFVMDGKRHVISGVFWFAFWDVQSFAREPWSAEEGGELLGDREVWSLNTESGNSVIHQQIIRPEDGVVISEKKFRKVGENLVR